MIVEDHQARYQDHILGVCLDRMTVQDSPFEKLQMVHWEIQPSIGSSRAIHKSLSRGALTARDARGDLRCRTVCGSDVYSGSRCFPMEDEHTPGDIPRSGDRSFAGGGVPASYGTHPSSQSSL